RGTRGRMARLGRVDGVPRPERSSGVVPLAHVPGDPSPAHRQHDQRHHPGRSRQSQLHVCGVRARGSGRGLRRGVAGRLIMEPLPRTEECSPARSAYAHSCEDETWGPHGDAAPAELVSTRVEISGLAKPNSLLAGEEAAFVRLVAGAAFEPATLMSRNATSNHPEDLVPPG